MDRQRRDLHAVIGRQVLILLLAAATLAAPRRAVAQSVLPDDYEESSADAEDDSSTDEDVAEPPADEEPEKPKKKKKPRKDDDAAAHKRTKLKVKDRHQTSGLGLVLRVGGLSTLRRMNFTGTDHRITHRPSPYLGGVIETALHVITFESTKSHLLVEAEGGYGAAKNADVEPALGRPLTTEQAYLMILGVFEKPIHPDVDLRLGLGISASSFTIEPNPDYTGHRYISVASSIGAAYWMSKRSRVGGDIVFFPGISTNQSAGDYGAARSFGGRGDAYFVWRFLQPEPPDLFGSAELGARYSFTRYRTAMPETQVLGDLASTDDTQHALTLTVAYHL